MMPTLASIGNSKASSRTNKRAQGVKPLAAFGDLQQHSSNRTRVPPAFLASRVSAHPRTRVLARVFLCAAQSAHPKIPVLSFPGAAPTQVVGYTRFSVFPQ